MIRKLWPSLPRYINMADGKKLLNERFTSNSVGYVCFPTSWAFWSVSYTHLDVYKRQYLYIPLGGNRVGEGRAYLNRFIVFLASGLWHGASWNFIIWGGLHGSYLVAASIRDKYLKRWNITLPKATWYVYLQTASLLCL